MSLYRRGAVWWAVARVHGRRYRESLRTKDKRVAVQRHAEFMKRADAMRAGRATGAFWERPRSISEDVAAYAQHLETRGRTAKHLRDSSRTVSAFLAARKIVTAPQATAGDAERWLLQLRRDGLAPRTVNKKREQLRAFGRWLAATGRVERDPFLLLPRLNEDEGRVYRRRALREAELRRLLDTVPRLRRTCYLTVATTGLRRSELASLLLEHLDLDAGIVWLAPRAEKARRGKFVALTPETVEALRDLQARRDEVVIEARGWGRRGRDRSAHVFPAVPSVRTLHRDLIAVGIEPVRGDVRIDFHALRKTFGTRLARAGVPLTTAQKLMRHSTPALTANIYTEVTMEDERAALARLPALGGER